MTKHSLNRPVLIVDDESDIRDLMEMTLMKMGLAVDTAEGVVAAKKKLDANRYSLPTKPCKHLKLARLIICKNR